MGLWQNLRGHLLDPSANKEMDETLRSIAKWTLDLLRNLVVVAGLQAVAILSDSLVLKFIALGAYTALYLYCFSYVRWFVPHTFPKVKNEKTRVAIILAILLVGGFLGAAVVSWVVPTAVRDIVEAQRPRPPQLPPLEE